MTVSMDGLRRNMAADFNAVVREIKRVIDDRDSSEYRELIDAVMELRGDIGCLLACYDPKAQPKDWNMLADDIELEELAE